VWRFGFLDVQWKEKECTEIHSDCVWLYAFFVISFIVYFPETLIFRSSQYKSFASWDYHLPIVISSLCLWLCCVLWGSKDGISSVQFSSYCIQWHFKIPTHYWLIETLRWNQPYIYFVCFSYHNIARCFVYTQSSFVGAIAIGDLIRSTLGPKGMVSFLYRLAAVFSCIMLARLLK